MTPTRPLFRHHTHLNRTLCDVLEEMRKAFETRNFSPLLGLIEEAQSMGNRMEAALYDGHDVESLTELKHNLKELIDNLVAQAKAAGATDEQIKECDDR